MARMSDSEVLAYADKICKMVTADSPARKKEYCKFISHSPDRYCNASTHQNCNRCKFFEPTVMGMLRVFVEGKLNMESENETLIRRIDRLNEELAIATETIDYYREENIDPELKKRQKELADEMRRRIEEDGQATDREESASNTDGKEDVDGEVGEDS